MPTGGHGGHAWEVQWMRWGLPCVQPRQKHMLLTCEGAIWLPGAVAAVSMSDARMTIPQGGRRLDRTPCDMWYVWIVAWGCGAVCAVQATGTFGELCDPPIPLSLPPLIQVPAAKYRVVIQSYPPRAPRRLSIQLKHGP